MRKRMDEQGMTLIEVMVAMVVFTIGVLGIISLQLNAVRANAETRHRDEANRILAGHAERVGMSTYGSLPPSIASGSSEDPGEELDKWKDDPFKKTSKGIEMKTGSSRYNLSRFVTENSDETKTVFFCVRWQGLNGEETMFRTVLKAPDREG